MKLSEADKNALRDFRKVLHQFPELSGEELETPKRILEFLTPTHPDQVIRPAGKNGLVVVYESKVPGPVVFIRADIDALPIQERGQRAHLSQNPGVAHLCGHDGHTTMVAALGLLFGRVRPAKGKVVLLFQAAEEIGQGAVWMIEDPQVKALQPDFVFGLHNIPGVPEGKVLLREGTFNAASRGIEIQLNGATSHAAEPWNGRSPMKAMTEILLGLETLPERGGYKEYSLVTVVHALLGEVAFGTSPGYAEVRATLRSHHDDDMKLLTHRAELMVNQITDRYKLNYAVQYQEVFPAVVNAPQAFRHLERAAKERAFDVQYLEQPMGWSEDFCHYSQLAPAAFFGLGAGVNQPELHHENYDFPDIITEAGVEMFLGAIESVMSED
ncbi:MAG: amidohydrolase [Bacteroidota bacterium]